MLLKGRSKRKNIKRDFFIRSYGEKGGDTTIFEEIITGIDWLRRRRKEMSNLPYSGGE